jgi:hypothetical protein
MRAVVLAFAVLVALAGSTAGRGASRITFCTGPQLRGTFAVVPGSAGAGNISYALRLRNRSSSACSVTGLPVARLLGRSGAPLPTHVRAAFPGALTAVLVTLAPGQTTKATARFSPDVPGTGEPVAGRQCERTAYHLRVGARGGGVTLVPVLPATPVCEHGSLQFSAYGR